MKKLLISLLILSSLPGCGLHARILTGEPVGERAESYVGAVDIHGAGLAIW